MNSQLVPFLNLTTMKGEAIMRSPMLKKPESVEYAVAHPFCIPLWVAVFAWLVQTCAPRGFWFVPLCFLLLWLASYLYAAPRLFAYYAAQEPRPAPSARLAEVKS